MNDLTVKRIFMLGPDPKKAHGGIESVIESYQNTGFLDKHQIYFVATHIESTKWAKLKIALQAWIIVVTALLKGRVLALHLHCASNASFWRKSIFIMTGYLFRVPILIHIHGSEPTFYGAECSSFKRSLIRRILNMADRVLVLSGYWYQLFKQWGITSEIKIIPNPVEMTASASADMGQRQLIFMGTLRPQKGVFELLAAFACLVKKYPDLHLVYAGIGESLTELKQRVETLGLQKQVCFSGWVRNQEKALLLQKSTIFVLPSYNENFPVSLLEAMSVGIPSVVTKVGGVIDIIQDGNNGLLIAPKDVEGIMTKVSQLLDSKELCQRLSENGRDYVAQHCESHFVMSLLENVYKELNLIK